MVEPKSIKMGDPSSAIIILLRVRLCTHFCSRNTYAGLISRCAYGMSSPSTSDKLGWSISAGGYVALTAGSLYWCIARTLSLASCRCLREAQYSRQTRPVE